MTELLASLLIPVYNVEPYLRECLDSAVGQTLSDIEIIAIDDGSTDGCPAILEEYRARDPRIRVITQANAGYGAAMNAGLSAARGKYIGILESDDFFEPDTLEVLCGAAERHGAQVAKANFWMHCSTPEPRDVLCAIIAEDMDERILNPQNNLDIFKIAPSIWSAAYQRDFLEENGICFLETPGASFQDISFAFKVWACAARVVLLEEPLVHYRQDNESASTKSPEKAWCVFDELTEIDRFLKSKSNGSVFKPAWKWTQFKHFAWNHAKLSEPQRTDFLLRFSEELKRDEELQATAFSLFSPKEKLLMELIAEDPLLFHEVFKSARSKMHETGL